MRMQDAKRASEQGMTVQVRIGSKSGPKIATLDIHANDLVEHVKEQIETRTGIDDAVIRLSRRFENGRVDQLWQLHNNDRVSTYGIDQGRINTCTCPDRLECRARCHRMAQGRF